jgi:hypothetical protein
MPRPAYQPIDAEALRTYSITAREHKVNVDSFAACPDTGASFTAWLDSLPDFLGASRVRSIANAAADAHRAGRPIVWAMGAHVVKVGCGPIVVDLIKRGVVSAVAMNGATAIHDVEVATLGSTSEEVAETIRDGSFGMVEETPAIFAEAGRIAAMERQGLGHALGRILVELQPPHVHCSILAAAAQANIPASVHVALGTDTVHMHANANGAQIGQASMTDFRLICSVVADMAPATVGQAAGMWWNIGSSVLLPEVFLKAVAVARNVGANLDTLTAVNMDMIRHYRPSQNVIGRPVQSGAGFELVGHHEIMLPLIRQAILEALAQDNSAGTSS